MNHPVQKNIGRYVIETKLGQGGMAEVYAAYDPAFKRRVAIKVLPSYLIQMDPTFSTRFKREAETIASIDHAAIVPVYDFGEEDGRPYLVMRLMTGGSLEDRLEEGALTLKEASEIMTRLASAIDKAHSKGIIHRDLKPGNILFDEEGWPYLADFGIVRLQDSTSTLTQGGIIGTPAYMSPEQARGRKDLDGRSDVYSLGAILFQMLTGKLPYESDTPHGYLMAHLTDPVPEIREFLPGAEKLQEVIVKAMAKSRDDRYASGREMADALEALSEGQPKMVLSEPVFETVYGPVSPIYPTQEVTQDEVGLPQDTFQVRPESPPVPKEPINLTYASSGRYPARKRKNQIRKVWVLLAAFGTLGVLTLVIYHTPGLTRYNLPDLTEPISASNAFQVQEVSRFPAKMCIQTIAFSPDGTTLATGGYRKGYLFWWECPDGALRLWRANDGKYMKTLESNEIWWDLAYAPDGQTLATVGATQKVYLWSVSDGQILRTLEGHGYGVRSVAFSPDGTILATGGYDNTIRLWGVSDGQLLQILKGHANSVESVAFSPDGTILASGSTDDTVRLWRISDGRLLDTLLGHTENVESVAFSPDGKILASGSWDATVRLWQVSDGQLLSNLEGEWGPAESVVFSPDGTVLASGNYHDTIVLWRVSDGEILNTLEVDLNNSYRDFSLAFSPDGTILASGERNGDIHLWGVR